MIKEDIKILTDYMLELNNDIQSAEEWVNTGADEEKYYAIKNVLEYLEKLKKENNRLRDENCRLKTIRYTTDFGTESIHLIPESDLVEINTNRYMIEIENGRFVDLKQIYQENEKYKRLAEMNLKSAEEFKNNICEHRCLLKSENKEQKELIERMKRFLLKENKMRDYLDYQESEE